MVHKIGERIQKYRKEQGLSQEEFGSVLNVSRQAISKWETGESLPDVYNLIAIARLFNVSIDELVLGTPSGTHAKNIIQETKQQRKKALVYARVCLVVMSLILAPPIVLMKALDVQNPVLGIIVATILVLVGAGVFVAVHFFTKASQLKEEMAYLEKIRIEQMSKEE